MKVVNNIFRQDSQIKGNFIEKLVREVFQGSGFLRRPQKCDIVLMFPYLVKFISDFVNFCGLLREPEL